MRWPWAAWPTRSRGVAGSSAVGPGRSSQLSRSQVREMQQALNARGFEVGTPDGIMGPNTRRGVREFQATIGTPPDGFATRNLLERLQR